MVQICIYNQRREKAPTAHLDPEVDEIAEDAELIGDVVEVALCRVAHMGRVLVDDVEQRDAVVVRGRHRRQRVEGTGAGTGERRRDLPCGSSMTIGHEHRRLLVADSDDPHVGLVEEGVVDRKSRHTWNPENGVASLGEQGLEQAPVEGPIGQDLETLWRRE